MKQGYILSIDQKCNGSEVLIFDLEGHVSSRAYTETPCRSIRTGWKMQDAEELCSAAMRAIDDALKFGQITPRMVRVIGITNESDSMVLWERDSGRPLGYALSRIAQEDVDRCGKFKVRRIQKMVREATGRQTDPCSFAGFKLCSMLEALPGLKARAERNELACGTLDSWLVYRLSGGRQHITDVSNALRTRLYDARLWAWNLPLLDQLGIPSGLMPEVRPLSQGYGETDGWAFFGVHGIPIAGIGEEQKAVLFG